MSQRNVINMTFLPGLSEIDSIAIKSHLQPHALFMSYLVFLRDGKSQTGFILKGDLQTLMPKQDVQYMSRNTIFLCHLLYWNTLLTDLLLCFETSRFLSFDR